jgi:hypothetical protein
MSMRIFHYPVVSEYGGSRSFTDLVCQVGETKLQMLVDSARQREAEYIAKISGSLVGLEKLTVDDVEKVLRLCLEKAKRGHDDLALGVVVFEKHQVLLLMSGGTLILDRDGKRQVLLSAKKGEVKASVGNFATHDVFLIVSHHSYRYLNRALNKGWVRSLSITDSVLNLQEQVKRVAKEKKKSVGVMLVSVVAVEPDEQAQTFPVVTLEGEKERSEREQDGEEQGEKEWRERRLEEEVMKQEEAAEEEAQVPAEGREDLDAALLRLARTNE